MRLPPRRRGGVVLPDAVARYAYTLADARTQLAAAGDGAVCPVVNPNTGDLFCVLRRVASGVYGTEFIDFRNGASSMVSVGTANTNDIQTTTSVTATFDATNGISFSGATFARLLFAGELDPRYIAVESRMRLNASTTDTGAYAGAGLVADDGHVAPTEGLAGAFYYDGASWTLTLLFNNLASPSAFTGLAYGGSFPETGTAACSAFASFDASDNSEIAGGFAADSQTEAGSGSSGAGRLDAATVSFYAPVLAYQPGTSDLTASWRTTRINGTPT